MIEVALMVEGQDGLDWPKWKRLAEAADTLGFAGLYRSDHFTNGSGPYKDALEMWISFAYLAVETKRIEFGPLVSPVSFRNPVVTAWSAAAVDDLSGGRFRIGLGAGWQEREHRNFGFDLLDLDQRFIRFEEGIRVVQSLLRSDEPVNLDGTYFPLEDAVLLPRPARAGGPPLVIGGNGEKRTMPLAAKYADEWNAVLIPAKRFVELNAHMDRLLDKVGRAHASVRRTMMNRITVGATDADIKRKTEGVDVEQMKTERGALIGTPNEVAEKLHELQDAGVQRIMGQMQDLTDLDGVELLASKVMPQLKA